MKEKESKGQKSPSKRTVRKKYTWYSYAVKRRLVHDVLTGLRTIEDARQVYGIRSKSVIYTWIKKYGLLTYNSNKEYQMKKSPNERIKELQMRIEELELEKDLLMDLTEAYEEEGVDVKKYLPEQLKREYSNRKKGAQ